MSRLYLFILFLIFSLKSYAQCGADVPRFTVNLTGNPDSIWTSPAVQRVGNCCGTSNPDKCISFSITLDPLATGINFDIIEGAVSMGALFYQIDCNPPQAVGQPICLTGAGPHNLTFCKPGNNDNVYQISSIPAPTAGTDVVVNDGCIDTLHANGFSAPSVTWNSIFPGASGAYNSYLSCATGCLNPIVTGQVAAPAYIDYQVCGLPAANCNTAIVCDTMRVTFNTTLIVTIAPQNPTICFGQASTTLTANGSGGMPPYNYLWSNGSTTQSINVGVGTFSVLMSDVTDCPPTSNAVTVTAFVVPITANAGANDTVCIQSPIATLNGSVTGASGGIWSGGAGVFSPNNTTLSNSTYTPTATELANGFVDLILTTTGNGTCLGDTDTSRIYFLGFTATVSVIGTNVSCYGGSDGSAVANINGGPGPFTYFWNTVPAQLTATATNLGIGTYSVTIQDGIGCSTQTPVTISQPLPLALSAAVTNVSCSGGSNGTISISPTGGTMPYSYLWQPGNQITSSITGQAAGTYSVSVTDSKGCLITSSYTITQPLPLTVALAPANVSCFSGNDGAISSTVSGGFTPYVYSWNPTGSTAPTASGLPAGTYTLTVIDSAGCAATSSIAITQPTALAASITSNNETCSYLNDGNASVIASGGTLGYTYLWQPGGLTTSAVSSLSSGTYTLTVTDSKACTAIAFATIIEPAPLVISFINQVNVTCFGGNNGSVGTNVSGGNPGYSYSWTPGGGNTAAVSGLSATTYSLTVTDNNGCQAQNTVAITQPLLALAASVSSSPTSCYGGANGSVTSNASGGTGPYSYNWMPGNYNGQNVSNIPSGTYTVTVTDSKNCTVTNSVTVNQPTQIAPVTSSVNSTCSNANGQASVAVSGGTGPYTYQWSPTGGNSTTATGLFSGAYSVLVTDNNGCTASTFVNVNDNTGPSASIFSTTNVSCNGGNTGSATVAVSGGTGTLTYSWQPSGGNGPTATGLTAGTYTVTVIDAIGCQSLATTSPAISEPPAISITLTTTDVKCLGGSDGTATVSATGGTGTLSYQWLPGGTTGTSITNLVANTSYTVQVTDMNSCVQTQTFSVSQPALLTATISASSNVSCFGGNNGTATVSVNGGTPFYSYSWAPVGGNGPTGTGLSVGTYTVNITDLNGCTASATIGITQPAQALSATSSRVAASCFGSSDGSGTVNPVGGTPAYTYQWSPSGATGQTATNLSAGTYFVLVTDLLGCQTNVALTILQPTQVAGTLVSTNPSCGLNNGSIFSQISGGTAPYTYNWLPGATTTSSISAVGPGTYTLQVTDSKTCSAVYSLTLTNIPGPTVVVSAINNVSCYGGNNGTATIAINNGTSPYSINWSPYGGTNLSATSLTAGTYTVNVTDALGCQASTTATITQPTPVTVSATSVNNILCNGGNSGSITVAASGGIPTYNYSWSPNVSGSPVVSGLTAGTYTVIVTDQNNCPSSISVNLSQPTAISTSISSVVNSTCYNGSNGSASVFVSGGILAYSYAWSTSPVQTGSGASNLSAGTYTVTITDGNGCNATVTAQITQPTQVITTGGINDTVCLGQSGVVTATATGGAGNYYYAWLPSNTVNSGTLNATPSSTSTYTVIAYDQNGCAGTSDTTSIVVYSLAPANVQAIAYSPICPGQTSVVYVQVTGTPGPLTYVWNNNLGNGPGGYSVTPAQPTTYIVTVSNTCGSSVTDSVQVLFNPPPTVSLTSDTAVTCVPNTVTFTDNSVTGNVSDPIIAWNWNFGDGTTSTQQNPAHLYTNAGTYSVSLTVTTSGGCTNNNSSAPLIINAYPFPIAAFTVNSTTLDLPFEQLIASNQSVGGITYNWSFGDGNTAATFNAQHVYSTVGIFPVQLIVVSQQGCADTATIQVLTNSDIVFPNVFTPGSGGPTGGNYDINSIDNNIFFPYTIGVIEFKLEIFNRWGELIFESFDVKVGWDGYYKGKICQPDVYVWKARIKLNNGKQILKTGDVTLLR
ncbi:MAG: PKD domain-containing protein [Bacteroidota bacterium]